MEHSANSRGRGLSLMLVAILALIAAACGSTTETTSTSTSTDTGSDTGSHEDIAQDSDSEDHSHATSIDVPAGSPAPEITIELTPDPLKGQNLHVTVANFRIAPEHVSSSPVDGEGHMHLYVDGVKITRFFNDWMHLDLPAGVHEVEVEISANNHSAYAVDGVPIRASAAITVAESDGMTAMHGHDEDADDNGGEVSWSPAPEVTLSVVEDAKSGWNVHAVPSNFRLAAEHASTGSVDGEGHMHLYVNGTKLARLYGEWFHIDSLLAGDNLVMVELNQNDHTPLTVDGQPVQATQTVTVAGDSESTAQVPSTESIIVRFEDGIADVDQDRFPFELGETVLMMVESDTADVVHVHGYDEYLTVTPGEPAHLGFVADIPGLFEIEFEESGLFIAELQVG